MAGSQRSATRTLRLTEPAGTDASLKSHVGSERPDPLIDLLARMIRTAQEREHTDRRATLTVIEGGKG